MSTEFYCGNRYLTLEQMEHNAMLIYDIFTEYGWSDNAICGMLGNMQRESTINPGLWQSLIEGSGGGGGYGLVQWTPWTNFTDWADEMGYEWDDGYAQCEWIEDETVATGQWIPTSQYPMKFSEFRVSTKSPEYLASVFLKNFERAGVSAEDERRTNARYWFDYIGGEDSDEPDEPVIPSGTKRKKMPVWMMLK